MYLLYFLLWLWLKTKVKNTQLTTWAGAVRDRCQGGEGCLQREEGEERLIGNRLVLGRGKGMNKWSLVMIIVQNLKPFLLFTSHNIVFVSIDEETNKERHY